MKGALSLFFFSFAAPRAPPTTALALSLFRFFFFLHFLGRSACALLFATLWLIHHKQ